MNTVTTPCVITAAPKTTDGYGQIRAGSKLVMTHRLAYCKANCMTLADIQGKTIMHTCDVPACVNPDHLIMGTHQLNMNDMYAKGRGRKATGMAHGKATISPDTLAEISRLLKAGLLSQRDLATKFGVSQSTVNRIKSGMQRVYHSSPCPLSPVY